MRENRLSPFLEPRYKNDGSLEIPLERAKDQLEKHTRYWPMIISQTTIFNMQAVKWQLYLDTHPNHTYLEIRKFSFTIEMLQIAL